MVSKIKQFDNLFNKILTKEQLEQIETMIKKLNKNKDQTIELEVSFKSIDYANYMRIIEYYIDNISGDKISSVNSLDVSITLADNNTYRVSISDENEIESFLQKFSKGGSSQEIQKYILKLNPKTGIEIMFKNRGDADKLFIEDLNIIFKATKETLLTKGEGKPQLDQTERMLFRYKQRNSFVLSDNVRLDITEVKESNNITNLASRKPIYEIEIEVLNYTIDSATLFTEVISVLKVVQDSPIPIGKQEAQSVIKSYQQLLGIKSAKHLISRNVISISIHHIINFIPNNYAVTDKADGDRYFLFSIETGVYLLSINLAVKKIDLQITDKNFYNMILDGELINDTNNPLFLAFDVVYANGTDFRFNEKYILTYRLKVLSSIIDKCFGTLIPFTDYTEKHKELELDDIKNFYFGEMKLYWKVFRTEMQKIQGTKKLFITRKIYFIPYGIDPSEVFMYADSLWKQLVYSNLSPYKLDGIIYSPENFPYMLNATPENLDTIPLEYKWKNSMQNSIDFFIKFQKDVNNLDAIFYDSNVVENKGRGYKICTLYVGVNVGNGAEKPIPFKINGNEQVANIYLIDDEARDSAGKVIEDNTVVEFIFDNTKKDINDAYKWIPIKTRYDKTESVQKYKERYGNNLYIALRIWKTIINPITEENIAALGNYKTYQREREILAKTIAISTTGTTGTTGTSQISTNKENSSYYEKKSSEATGMRAFHNWIKSNMILTYGKNKHRVLDIGVGRGGDLLKFVHANIGEYVGVDIDNNGLYVIGDSANLRYQTIKQKNKNVPPMYFINADARGLFNVQSQQNIIPTMSDFNKQLIETHLSGNKKYDIINAQFTLHYYLSDKLSWSNFCKNINDHFRDNGYLLITTFDGRLIYDRLLGKQKMTATYTDDNGQKNTFFEIVKTYNDTDIGTDIGTDSSTQGIGMAINVYNSLISSPGTYITEYLVFPDFLEKSLKEKCGLELIESDSFFNLFNLYKNYFTQTQTQSPADPTDLLAKKHYDSVRAFYKSLETTNNTLTTVEQSDVALASFKFSILNRYYIFKKTNKIDDVLYQFM